MFNLPVKTVLNYVFFFVIAVFSGVAVVASVQSIHPSPTQGLSRSGTTGYYIVRKPNTIPSTSETANQANISSSSTSTSAIVPVGSIDITLDIQEVAKHNSQNDCWLIIDSGIYDVTVYLPQHPGSASAIIPYCGTEASSAFHSKGGRGRDHATYVNSILAQYLIANLGETVQAIPVQPQLTTTSPDTTSQPGGGSNPGPIVQPTTTLTGSEIAVHNTSSDCWIIVSGYVYNVTNFLPQHPGSASAIIPYCGGDATGGLNGSSGSRKHNHSNYAYSLLNNYLIGAVGSSVIPPTGGGTPTPIPPTTGTTLPANVLKTFPSATLIKAEDGGREFKINSGGACYQIKTDASGNVTQSEPC
jgi:cytochrome b involved in lipid metabolism